MRDIKFRAWDKEKNKMIYSDETYPRSEYKFEFEIFNDYKFTLSKMTDRFNVVDKEGDDYYIETYSPVDAEIMQYTGLKDKNGKEIYEGDIVQGGGLTCNDGFEILNDMSIVTFKEGMFKAGELSLCSLNNQCEVIGNTYENPELLK